MALFHATAKRLADRKQIAEIVNSCSEIQRALFSAIALGRLEAWKSSGSPANATAHVLGNSPEEGNTSCQTQAYTAAAPLSDTERDDENFERLSRLRQVLQGVPDIESVPVEEQRLLHVGIIGVPNAGKSTLTNRLVGSKVSAVSDKTNTTFVPTLGGFTEGNSQVVLHDTPGVVDSRHYRNPTQLRRVRSAWTTAKDCDLLLLLIDAHRQIEREDIRVTRLVEELAAGKQLEGDPPATFLLLNKIDKIKGQEQRKLEKLGGKLSDVHDFEGVLQVSAANGTGVAQLRQLLLSRAQPRRWVLEQNQSTDRPQWDLAVEVVREKVFKRLRQELPYELEIRQTEVQQRHDGSLLLKQDVLVPSETVRRMVVGKRGSVIGEIGLTARQELERILQRKVHLYLGVKLRP